MNCFPNYFKSDSVLNEEGGMTSQCHFQTYPGERTNEIRDREGGMTNQFHFQTYPEERANEIEKTTQSNIIPCEQVTTLKRKKFSFLWNVKNFKEFMDRQYEFTSPIFSEKLSSGTSKWKMILHPQNIYPEGVNISLQLLVISEVDKSYSVMYKILLVDESGKHHELKVREKVFRHTFDFDECPVISNICLKDKKLLNGNSLVVKCNFDLLECKNQDVIPSNPCAKLDSSDTMSSEASDLSINRSFQISDGKNYQNGKNNIPYMIQSMNDLSCFEPHKKSSDSEKNVNSFIEKDSLLENNSGEFDVPNCKIQGLEVLSNDLKHLYYNSSQHDVVIYVDDGKLTAHEIILSSRSEYFKKALMAQKNKELDVPGLNVETLQAVLHYLYTGKLKQMTENSALDLLKASNLLELPCLENLTTSTFLCSRIRTSNVTNVFLMAKELKIESLKNCALKFMAENRDEVTKTEQWNELMKNDPHSAGEVLLTVAYYQNKVPNNASSI